MFEKKKNNKKITNKQNKKKKHNGCSKMLSIINKSWEFVFFFSLEGYAFKIRSKIILLCFVSTVPNELGIDTRNVRNKRV